LLSASAAEAFWAHGDLPAAAALAEKTGFKRARVLWQMRRSLTDFSGFPETLPEGVTLRHFRPGHDEEAWLEVNARAFAHHPEQGRWTLADLRLREAEPWFDPAGFLLAVDISDTLLGFHWTKVHPPAGDDPALGEIYVLGVDPGGHRRGLGVALSVAGLRHLADTGLTQAMLYVDESNAAAVALYRKLGFDIYQADVNYQR
jgi:mycothiol synthase